MTRVSIGTLYDICRQRARSGGLPIWRQFAEIAILFALRRLGPGYYLQARFGRREIPFREKWQHFNDREYRKRIYGFNPANYQKLSQHKVAEKSILSLYGLPTSRFIGHFHGVRGMDSLGRPLKTAIDLDRVLRHELGGRICFKTVEGHGGSSFAALDVVEHGEALALRHPLNGTLFLLTDWVDHLGSVAGGWIIEEYLEQHPTLHELNPDSVNTLRLLVVATAKGFETRGALLRVGRKGSQVDNTSSGGLACPIDLRSGRLQDALDLSPARTRHSIHPDTGATLVGAQVPHWPACIDLASRALSAFPKMNFAGVDIAVTETSPYIIELNVFPDRRSATHLDLPHRRLFDACRRL